MIEVFNGFRLLEGTPDILIVTPHSPSRDGKFENDVRTGIIAEEAQRRLGCCAIINDRFVKPTPQISKSYDDYLLDLFRIDHSRKVPGYLDSIRRIIEGASKTLVIWVHGIADPVAVYQGRLHMELGVFAGPPEALQALIGCGQGGDPKTGDPDGRPTVSNPTAETFRDRLSAGGMTALITHPEGNNFRGRDEKRLNQWFNHLGYGIDRVESLQLEIKESGWRDSRQNAINAGRIIAEAVTSMRQTGG